jgi:HPt (histidine-containing phosphotransfer) domain-containing protein
MSGFIRKDDIKGFSTVIHAMKSALATIGAAGLSETALRLETASKNGDAEYCNEHFPAFIQTLLTMRDKLSLIFPEEKSIGEREKVDMIYLAKNIHEAIGAINDFNKDNAIDIISKLSKYDFGVKINTQLTDAVTALKEFDFYKANSFLTGLLNDEE